MESLGSVEKAIDVLFHLHRQPGSQGVTAIGRALGLPKSSAHRLLAALGGRGLVERNERGQYRTGMGLVALGLGALEREPVVVAATPVLEAEAEALGETVFLVGARAGRPVVLSKAEGTGFLRAAPRVGDPVPVHATAVGKLFLAFGGGSVTVPEGELERFTERTRVSADTLERELRRVRERGFAENREEWIPGLAVIAAPILRSVPGEPVPTMAGALAVAAPAPRLEALGRASVAERVRAAAARVAAQLEGKTS